MHLMSKNPVAKNMNRFNRSQTINDKRYKNYLKYLDNQAKEAYKLGEENDKKHRENISEYEKFLQTQKDKT